MSTQAYPRLAELLAPIGIEAFFDTYFETRFLHIARDPEQRVAPLLSIERVERIVWEQCDHLADFAKVRRGDAFVPAPAKQPFQWVRREFNRGSSIILDNVQRYDAPFAEFHRQLENDLQMPVDANVYLTPASARTFPAHFDSHDTFIVHLHGTKTWRIHEQAVAYPMSHHVGPLDPATMGPPVAEFDVHPGDVLYIPRGTVHWATSNTEPSLHVTLGWYPLRQVDLLQNLVRLAADAIPELRRAVPLKGLMAGDVPSLPQVLRQLAEFAGTQEAGRAAVARWADKRVARSQVIPDGGLLGIRPQAELALEDWVERDAGLPCRVSVAEDRATIAFGGYPSPTDDDRPAMFAGPAFLGETFEAIAATTGPFAVSSLRGQMTDDSKILLAKQLVEAGLLRRVRYPSA